jgi:hypothetical protein
MPLSTPSNLEYLGPKPNFTRDTYDTLEAMQEALDSGHIDEGHQTYCTETGITYRAVKGTTGLVWEDTVGNLQRELTQKILDNEKVASEALWDLNSRLSKVESEITDDESGGMGPETRLDQVYDWFDAQTHIPVLTSQITKSSEGNLRQGTTHIYNAEFTWDWANREPGVTGFSVSVGSETYTKTFTEASKDPKMAGGTYVWPLTVTLGSSATTLKASFYNTDVQGKSQTTVTPLTPTYTWSLTGLPGTWEDWNLNASYTLRMTVTGKNLATSSEGDRIYGTTAQLGTVSGITDSNQVFTENVTVRPTMAPPLEWSWKSSTGTVRSSKSYTPYPSFYLGSPQKNAGVASLTRYNGGYQAYLGSGPTTIPEYYYSAGSTGLYLSPYDIRGLSVKSLASGSDTWVTITGFSESGTISYAGKTYYYLMNPNIGAGRFQFKFA